MRKGAGNYSLQLLFPSDLGVEKASGLLFPRSIHRLLKGLHGVSGSTAGSVVWSLLFALHRVFPIVSGAADMGSSAQLSWTGLNWAGMGTVAAVPLVALAPD